MLVYCGVVCEYKYRPTRLFPKISLIVAHHHNRVSPTYNNTRQTSLFESCLAKLAENPSLARQLVLKLRENPYLALRKLVSSSPSVVSIVF
jgi:hypothetical protein